MADKKLIDLYPYRQKKGGDFEFLLMKRAKGEIYEHQWRMIGGKVKDGEPYWEAALRELEEETGLRPESFWTIPSLNHFYEWSTDQVLLIPAFAAKIRYSDSITLNREHSVAKWFDINTAAEMIFWPEQERILKLLHKIVTSDQILDDWHISQN